MSTTAIVHDHVVLLLEKEEFENPPAWLAKNFHIIEGGTHAGRSSRNKLIVFKDGTYLELFNWIATPTEFLAWADKKPGLIDFALTTMPPVTAEQNHQTVSTNLSRLSKESDLGVSYAEPASGGRTRADGTEVKWKTTRPAYQPSKDAPNDHCFPTGRNDFPFYCHDVTNREVRVPFKDETITTHPCGAIGIQDVQVWVPQSHFDAYLDFYRAVTDVKRSVWLDDGSQQDHVYCQVGVPQPIDSVPIYVSVHTRPDDDSGILERGIGIMVLVLRQEKPGKGTIPVPLGSNGISLYVKLAVAADVEKPVN